MAVNPSSASGVSAAPLLGDTIGQNLERAVAAYGDREALVEVATGRRWTCDAFSQDVDVLARGLMAGGIEKGDRVGIWAPNRAEWTLNQSGVMLLLSARRRPGSAYLDGRSGAAARRGQGGSRTW